jgi:hypothetical protein
MADGKGLARTLEITSDAEDGTFVAVVEFFYTEEELTELGISEENIKIYRWDDDQETWFVEGTLDLGNFSPPDPATVLPIGWYGIDIDNNFAWAVVDHFSVFGLGNIEEEEEGDGGAGNSGSSNCFIATAAYGTPMAEEVKVLREFRDIYLLSNPIGKSFVDTYYKISPRIASFIKEHPILKSIVKNTLTPLIWMSTEVAK